MHPAKTDYGIDAPGVIRNLFVIGVALSYWRASCPWSHLVP